MKYILIFLITFSTYVQSAFADTINRYVSEQKVISFLPLENLRDILGSLNSRSYTKDHFGFKYLDQDFLAETTLDIKLQTYLDDLLSDALGAQTAIVCINPVSGKVLALAGFDKKGGDHVWSQKLVPAASLFKIVTAAGALELYNLSPHSLFYYNGGKHTLYRYQLKDRITKSTHKVTLKEAFAYSINPVFGKIGQKYLKKDGLMLMAKRFLWQSYIPFELPVAESVIEVGDKKFNLAEVASGFNKKTKLTALHAALIAAGVINGGVIMTPYFIEAILNTYNNQLVYESKIYPLKRCINPKTATFLKELMIATVEIGTAKKAFNNFKKDKILKELIIGGKTGTMDNEDHTIRYDLFSGFACNKDLTKCIALGIFVAHEGILGTRAAEYARFVIKKYFEANNEFNSY